MELLIILLPEFARLVQVTASLVVLMLETAIVAIQEMECYCKVLPLIEIVDAQMGSRIIPLPVYARPAQETAKPVLLTTGAAIAAILETE